MTILNKMCCIGDSALITPAVFRSEKYLFVWRTELEVFLSLLLVNLQNREGMEKKHPILHCQTCKMCVVWCPIVNQRE